MKLKMLCVVGIIFLSLGATKSANAACITASVDCGGGKGGYGLVCGDSGQEMADNAKEMADVICGG
ncbi:hypothetical protein DWB61_00240 [Ancylomarina euxinus]|uniref:NVEALA protein n=1 Tax=Ancylomarina euxinus TaxID=2283627 RepID=A0A425Y7Y2_9BACT|nr:hypothetical protein [Ancylomarina euxinus]MCZ4693660.1 hypothetical protein [Ancylomarina euxinus]MUP13889.1 hypothetical protein [Ancylomarina euxinus]RRG24482.1 hypothetical protein DWB61_00240 [Ancylomarina euxinus]